MLILYHLNIIHYFKIRYIISLSNHSKTIYIQKQQHTLYADLGRFSPLHVVDDTLMEEHIMDDIAIVGVVGLVLLVGIFFKAHQLDKNTK